MPAYHGQRPERLTSDPANLISGRLGAPLAGDGGGEARAYAVHYGVSRLGLARPAPNAAQKTEPKHPPRTSGEAPATKKASFKLPKRLIHWLKAYAQTTEHYQYAIVAEALEHYLAQVSEQLDIHEQANLAELECEYDQLEPFEPTPPQPTVSRIGFHPDPPACDPAEYDREIPEPYPDQALADLCSIPDLQGD